jgi:signal transduction histidine kinase
MHSSGNLNNFISNLKKSGLIFKLLAFNKSYSITPHTLSKAFLLAVFILLTGIKLHAQLIPSRPVTLLDHTVGIDSPYNYYIYKDSRGLVWICSISELYQYDGRRIKVYKPDPEGSISANPNHVHSSFCEDQKGNLWFGTWRSLVCYIRKEDRFKSYEFANANPSIRFSACGFDNKGQLWFIHNNAIFTLDTVTSAIELRAHGRHDLFNAELRLDQNGQVVRVYCYSRYKMTPGLSMYEFKDSALQEEYSLFLDESSDSIAVSDIQLVNKEECLIATSKGLYSYNELNKILRKIQPGPVGGVWIANTITVYKDSFYLVASETHGYLVFDDQGMLKEQFQIHYKGDPLHEVPLSMYTDPEGTIWMHLSGRGVAYFQPKQQVFDFYPFRIDIGGKVSSSYVQALIELDNQTVFAGCSYSGGLFIHLRDGQIDRISRCEKCPLTINSAMKDSKGRIWMNSSSDLYMMDEKRNVSKLHRGKNIIYGYDTCELPDGRMLNISNGKIFISGQSKDDELTFSRLLLMDTTLYYTYAEMLPDHLLYTSATKKDSAPNIQLCAFDPLEDFRKIRSISVPWGIKSWQKIPDSDEALLGTTHGPVIFNLHTGSYSTMDYSGCGTEAMWGILPLPDKKYLLCGEQCVSKVDMNTKTSQRYGLDTGLGANGVTWYGSMLHSSGTVWLGHTNGFSVAHAERLDIPKWNTSVNIGNILVNDQQMTHEAYEDTTILNPNEIKEIRLPHRLNTVSFDFAALSYSGIDAHEYEYRMSGLEGNWIDGGRQGFARYVNLPSGKFMFEVRVKNQPHSVHNVVITIIPPFYARIWFIAIVIFFLGFLIFQAARIRERRKQHLERLKYEQQLAIEHDRLRISNNLHDDLGSGLSALHLKAQVISQQTHDPSVKVIMNELAENTGKLAGQIRHTIWTINAQNDTIDSLMTRLHQYALDYFEESGINCRIELMQEQTMATIQGSHRNEIYLAFKEALHNIYKHANADQVTIKMNMENQTQLVIEIHDNGNGFDPAIKNSGLGMNSMRNRMKGIGGEFSLSSDPGGTSIRFIYPL